MYVKDIEKEVSRFNRARDKARTELMQLYETSVREMGEANASIFEMQQELLDNHQLIDLVINIIVEKKLNAEYAMKHATETYLKKAAAMCPVKFIPLYQLSELYQETGRKEEARVLAKKILDKKVKIPSPVINSIIIKMRNLLNEPDSLDDSSQMIIHDFNPITTLQWQDCPLDLRTPKALLPT